MRRRHAIPFFVTFVLWTGCVWTAASAPCNISEVLNSRCNCQSKFVHKKCGNSAEEVNGLSCFGQRTTLYTTEYSCSWKAAGLKTFDLLISQRSCKSVTINKGNMTSDRFSLADTMNMTAYAIAMSDNQTRCIFAQFSSLPSQIVRCGPPKNVSFKRHSGALNVTVKWEDKSVKNFSLTYSSQNSTLKVMSQNSSFITVRNLSWFLSYEIQIQCVENKHCPQCPSSEVIRVPTELIHPPVIKDIINQPVQAGQRKLMLNWEFGRHIEVDYYNVTVQKASGELSNYTLKTPHILLFLCYSSYNISILAANQAGFSPATHVHIEAREGIISDLGSAVNVTIKSENKFSFSWDKELLHMYHCYSVEWWSRGEKSEYELFLVNKDYNEHQTQNAVFKPYKRYNFLIHIRPEKNICTLSTVNKSELTYGGTQAYLTEGDPDSAPGNVTVVNITQNSVVISWIPVSEKDLRGFLRGYIIRCIDILDNSEKSISFSTKGNSYELRDLQSSRMYRVQLSAFTAAGKGKPSDFKTFETLSSVAVGGMLTGVLVGILVLILAMHLFCRLLQRSKDMLWPSIPNPYKSNAVQKMSGQQDLEMRTNLEETEECLCVLEISNRSRPSCSISLISQDSVKAGLISDSLDSMPSEDHTADFIPWSLMVDSPKNSSREGSERDSTMQTVSVATAGAFQPVVGDYTTMDLFQQLTAPKIPDPSVLKQNSELVNPGQNYIRQVLSGDQIQSPEKSSP